MTTEDVNTLYYTLTTQGFEMLLTICKQNPLLEQYLDIIFTANKNREKEIFKITKDQIQMTVNLDTHRVVYQLYIYELINYIYDHNLNHLEPLQVYMALVQRALIRNLINLKNSN